MSIEKTSPCSCIPQPYCIRLQSPQAAIIGVTIGGILLALGLLLHNYAGMGTFGMCFLSTSGITLMIAFALIQAGKRCIQFCSQPRTAYAAIDLGNLDRLKEMNCDPNTVDSEYGSTPFERAVTSSPKGHGCDPIIQYLVEERGADVKAPFSDDGSTPLYMAILWDHSPATIALLLDHGADIDAGQETPLHLAVRLRREDIIKLLIERGADLAKQDLIFALEGFYADDKTVELLLDSGKMDLHAADQFGRTALYWALARSNDTLTRKLLDKGVDPNTKRGDEPLFHKLITRDIEMFKFFVTAGANLNVKGKNGKNAVTLAEEAGLDPDYIKELRLKAASQPLNV